MSAGDWRPNAGPNEQFAAATARQSDATHPLKCEAFVEKQPMTTQRVLITAEATGIGREIARAFVAIAMFVCDIDTKALEAIAAAMPELKTGICDMSSRQHIERMIGECAKAAPEGED